MKKLILLICIVGFVSLLACKHSAENPNKEIKKQAENIENDFDNDDTSIEEEPSFEPNAVINFEYTDEIPLMNSRGEKIASIKNNEETEDYISLKIERDSLQYFYVKTKTEITEEVKSGWLKKETYIGTYARNYEDGQVLNLYTTPNLKTGIKSSVKEWIPNLYTITKINDDWVYVELRYENRNYSGWLEPDMQCANSYTTCN